MESCGADCESLDNPGTLANLSVILFRPLGMRFLPFFRLLPLIMLSKLRILLASCSPSSSSSSSSSSALTSDESDVGSSTRIDRLDPGREGTSTICCPDSSSFFVRPTAPGNDAAILAIENPVSRRRRPNPGRELDDSCCC